jgi:hypothetical protein
VRLKPNDTSNDEARLTRLIWLASIVVPAAVLLLLFCAAQPAHSLTIQPPLPGGGTPIEVEETEEAEEELEECGESELEEEDEEAEEECGELEEEDPFPPEECVLQTARARVFAYTSHDKVRLVISYTSVSPAEVIVDYRLKGAKGSLKLGEARQRFSKQGLFRLSESLSKAEMAKVRSAKEFTVEMEIPGTPRYCHRFYDRHLTIKHSVHNQLVWFQSDSIFGTGGSGRRHRAKS